MAEFPTGTVTFLFTDVEGSTRLLQEFGDDYADVLKEHRRALRDAFARHGGVEVDTQGDAFFIAFAKAADALAAAADAREALVDGAVRVRIGVHTGEPLVTDEGYVGIDVHRAARIAAAGHGGQILVSQSTRDLCGPDALRDLGEHRLKDLSAPERIYQLGDDAFPPLKSLNQTNLPVQPTPLVGRENELQEVRELLRRSRLLTLTGAGGSGKTRLALQAAAEAVDEFPDGVWFVSLAALTDPQLIEPTIAQAVGSRLDLAEFLRERKLLLLLDNLEQLLPEVAGIVASLDTQILATSRERLNVASEQEYEVPTLSIDDAVALFTQRARQLKPKFDPDLYVTEIVRRLDGLPLAVELAAARAKLLSAKEIAFRLESGLDFLGGGARDRPERQQTLRAAIAWSHELLSEADQRHFSSVAVFSGSFGLDAAEAVAGLNLDALASLVDKSLLRRTEDDRFFQLETIREYARERLAARRDAAELQQRHAGWFLRLAEEIGPGLRGPAQASLLDQLEREVNNLRTAARWYRSQDPVLGVRLATASWRFWFMHGRVTEGRRLLEAAISQADALPSELRAEALTALSRFTGFQGDLELAEAQTREALAIYRSVSNGRGVAFALHSLAIIAAERGGYAESARLEEEARSLGEQLGDEVVVTNAISGLATLALDQSDSIRAEELYAEALTRCRKLGDAYGVATGLSGIALAALQREDYDGALPPLVESIGLAQELGWTENYVYTLEALSCLAAARGERRAAARLLGCAEALREGIGAPVRPFERALHNRALAAVRSTLESDVLEAEWSAGRAMSPEVAVRSGLETASVASVD